MTGSIQAWTMDNTETGSVLYGQSHINVYIPREEQRDVPPPSPVCKEDDVYKFSDQVQKDRHLFNFGRNAILQLYSTQDEQREKPRVRKMSPKPDDDEKDNDSSAVNVVRLRLSSAKSDTTYYRKSNLRFNERLSAYVSTRKKINNDQKSEQRDSRTRREGEGETNETFMLPRTWHMTKSKSSHAKKVRKGMRYRTAKSDTSGSPLPPLLPTQRVVSRKGELRQERTMWFPDTASPAYAQHSKMPTRPSSKPHTIWRQSTDILIGRKTSSISDLMSDNLSQRGYLQSRQNTLV